MRKIYLVLIIIVILVLVWFFVRFVIGGSEDDWIKDGRGVWVKHGFPSEIPEYVGEQQKVITQALELYGRKKQEGMIFSSQCLGTIGDSIRYVVDVVHVPRSEEDNLVENQCRDYRIKRVKHFIELDRDGNIVRIV